MSNCCRCTIGKCESCDCLFYCTTECKSGNCENTKEKLEFEIITGGGSGGWFGKKHTLDHFDEAKTEVQAALVCAEAKIKKILSKKINQKVEKNYVFNVKKSLDFVEQATVRKTDFKKHEGFGFNDGHCVSISGKKRFNKSSLCSTLFHEALHNSFDLKSLKGLPGNPKMDRTDDGLIEHWIMALLGDPVEIQNFKCNPNDLERIRKWLDSH